MWHLQIASQANKDFDEHKRGGRKGDYSKCFDLIREILTKPDDLNAGSGKPEHLKAMGKNVWSRRINGVDRIVYIINPDNNLVTITSAKDHYNDH